MSCWSCQAAVQEGALACAACGRVQPPGPAGDPFADLGLPRAFTLPPGEPERARREGARRVHPDRFARAEPRERRCAAEQAARMNGAFRALADPASRAEVLLRLLGHPPAEAAGAPPDPELAGFLEEQLALRERLAEARAAGDVAAAREVGAVAEAWLAALPAELARHLDGVPGPAALAEAGRLLARARYHRALAEEAEAFVDGAPGRAPGGP